MKKYRLLAKEGPNNWVEIGRMYPALGGLPTLFDNREEAALAKGRLKGQVQSKYPKNKVPLQIREIESEDLE